MSPPDKRPPPRPGSSPELQGVITPDQPEKRAVRNHPGLEGAPQPAPKRSQTLVGLPAPAAPGSVPPPPPALPIEFAPTKRPPLPWGKTMRAPTPPEVMAQARREPPPLPAPEAFEVTVEPEVVTEPSSPQSLRKPSPLPAPSQRPEEARAAALARDNERLRRERDDARAAAKAQPESEAPPESGAAGGISDEAIGKLVRELTGSLARKVGLPTALIAMLGGGGYALKVSQERPEPPPLTAEQLNERLDKFEGKVIGRLDGLTTTVNGVIDVTRCVRKKTNQVGGSLLPAPDRMGAALKQSPYEDDCPDSPKRLPEPKSQ